MKQSRFFREIATPRMLSGLAMTDRLSIYSLYRWIWVKRTRKEAKQLAKDPVCNMNVDEKKAVATSVYKGKTYYFCAKGCKEKFDKEPEKFVEKGEK
ncbi:MAG: YHS domain-containing protein [Nitrospirota bacterium]|nr:YHS domain-containing protein [Nitrospirota bacterium]